MKKIISAVLAAGVAISAFSQVCVFAESNMTGTEGAPGSNPVISRNCPVYSKNVQNPVYANDDYYYSLWTGQSDDYIAYDLSGVPKESRKKVDAVWYNLSSYDRLGPYLSVQNEPVDYTIELNKAAGGEYPESGWEVVEDVKDNQYCSRQHIVSMEGFNWIRIKFSKSTGDTVSMNFDIHDVSNGVSDSWMFFGDSITAGGMGNAYGTGFAKYINNLDDRYFPIEENGGIGGIRSIEGRENIDKWLKTCNANYVSIAYGTNDAWGQPGNAEQYYENTKYMIDAIIAAGKTPVLPKIPSSTNKDVGPNISYYNAMVEKLWSEYDGKLVKGPDFAKFFEDHPEYLGSDGVHPSSEGYDAMRQEWAKVMYENVYKNKTSETVEPTKKLMGDVVTDGKLTVADAVLFQKYILNAEKFDKNQYELADITDDGNVNAKDLAMLKIKIFGFGESNK